jgi:integrase
MIAWGLRRKMVNSFTARILCMFRWAVAEEPVPVEVFQALAAVDGLRKARTEARERPPVGPVSDEAVEKTLAHLPPVVAAMVRVQRLTGMRPQEVVGMQAVDIEMSDPACWVHRPGRHKTEHHDRERVVFIGPQALACLREFLRLDVHGALFSPRRSETERNDSKRAERKTPLYSSHVAHQARKRQARPRRELGDCYTVASNRRAIARACEAAGVERWSPHQLRHSAATRIRRRFGLEAAQAVLGHAELGTTRGYAERDQESTRRVILEIG